MKSQILQGNVFDVLPSLTPGSVDVACTSPPYWMLRSYLAKDHPLKHLELGSEKTPAEFVANMVRVFRLVRTALADHGTCWLNMGDSYASSGAVDYRKGRSTGQGGIIPRSEMRTAPSPPGIDAGNLCLIPQRLAIALQDDGWLVRSVVVWHKPAPMPASVSGWAWRRCRVKVAPKEIHEQGWGTAANNGRPGAIQYSNGGVAGNNSATWSDCPGCKKCSFTDGYVLRKGSWRPTSSWEPILMLAKKPGYYCDGEAVKQPPASATVSRDKYTRVLDDPDEQFAVRHDHETICDGANLRDVWTIASEPLKEGHYAAFPTELVYRCLAAGTSSRGYCPTCGKPWARVVETKFIEQADSIGCIKGAGKGLDDSNGWGNMPRGTNESKTLAWRQTCRCEAAEPRPGLVLDPFSGSGRTGIQAQRMGLDFVGVDLNPAYVEMSQRLLYDANPLFAESP